MHVAGLTLWCGALLYLPALVATGASRAGKTALGLGPAALNRLVFTGFATPAALFTIVTGSTLFLLDRNLGLWLTLKLTAVTGMVVCHVLCGLVILRHERNPHEPSVLVCALLGSASAGLIGAVLWLVLAKPFLE